MSSHSRTQSLSVHGKAGHSGYAVDYYGSSPTDSAGSATSVSDHSRSSYAVGASTYSYDTSGDYNPSATGIDAYEYFGDRLSALDPTPLDRSIVTQAQSSGKLNAKHRDLLEAQAKVQARLAKFRQRAQEGFADAHEVRADLEWTSNKVASMKSKASRKHPKEYRQARERYPSPEY